MEGVVQSRRNHETVYLDCEPCHELCNHAPEAASQAKRRWNPKHQWHTPFYLPFPTLKIAYRACLSVRLQKIKSVAPVENLCSRRICAILTNKFVLPKNPDQLQIIYSAKICAPTNHLWSNDLCTTLKKKTKQSVLPESAHYLQTETCSKEYLRCKNSLA
jgi:hypothetical protein